MCTTLKKLEKCLQNDFHENSGIYEENICFHKKMKREKPENWSQLLQRCPAMLQSSGRLGTSCSQPVGELYSWQGCISQEVAQLLGCAGLHFF